MREDRISIMSENARAVAREVLATVGKGRKVSIRKIAPKHGYSPSVADNPKKITRTKAYREAIDPVIAELEAHRTEVLTRMRKEFSKARYRDLADSLDKLTKQIQLLSGKATDRHDNRVVSWNYIAPADAGAPGE